MKIAHFTNTFLPHVGGVARAVQTILEDQRRARHRVLVVAPEFAEGTAPPRIESSVVRIPAFTHFNDSDFSVSIPFATLLSDRLSEFRADLIHTHHPFLLGDTALREASSRRVPLVFTHHTLYENYVHYLPVEGDSLAEFAADVATRFANCCTAVVAPSQSVHDLIVSRGVTVPVHVIPTGIDTRELATGRNSRGRERWNLPAGSPVIGHLGRLAAEKNLPFLASALVLALKKLPRARALIVGDGPQREEMTRIFAEGGLASRVIFTGKLSGSALRDACAAMTVFAFTSTSETQGLVLAEAMATSTPVVALDASGVREVVVERRNGRLLPADTTPAQFSKALVDLIGKADTLARYSAAALTTAKEFDRARTSKRLLELYATLVAEQRAKLEGETPFERAIMPVVDRIAIEGRLLADKTGALVDALRSGPSDDVAKIAPPGSSAA
ncbi:MAG: glycosyltransferase [Opitutaceae bacterium]